MKDFRKTLLLTVLPRYIVSLADAALGPADAALGSVDAASAALLGIAARKHFTIPE